MEISSARFVSSLVKMAQLPKPDKPEFAFIGRSNVGKSSLINMLTRQKGLAKVSGTPGKTQTINHFLINESWYLVDLPGYGYARAPKTEREKWGGFTSDYLLQRSNLICVCVLLDVRLAPQKIDLEFMEWLGLRGIPFVMIFTKTDKLGKTVLQKNLAAYKKEMLESWESLPELFLTSSTEQKGREELLAFVDRTHTLFTSPEKR